MCEDVERPQISLYAAIRMNVSCFQTFKGLKRFVSMHAATFNLQRHLISRRTLRTFRAQAMADWNAATAAA